MFTINDNCYIIDNHYQLLFKSVFKMMVIKSLTKTVMCTMMAGILSYPTLNFAQEQQNNVVQMPIITVIAEKDNVFQIPKAISHRDADVLGQDMNNIIRNIPGVFTQHMIGQGDGIDINIRGLEGLGRVNTMVDGVTQTSFISNFAHGLNSSTAFVDSNFITSIDIERGSADGLSGVNALGGAVNFRTIAVDDLVDKEKNLGAKTVFRIGDNGYGRNGMQAFAYKDNREDGSSVGVLVAISAKEKFGYKNAAGETVASTNYDDTIALESGLQSYSSLLKLQYKPNRYHDLTFSHMLSHSQFNQNHNPLLIDVQTGLLQYKYKPLSDLVDLEIDTSYSLTAQKHPIKEYISDSLIGQIARNPSLTFTIQNKSIIDIGSGDLILQYGGKLFNNQYRVSRPEYDVLQGKQKVHALFTDIKWNNDIWMIGMGLGYEQYAILGHMPPTEDQGSIIFPSGGDFDFNRKEKHFNPRLNFAFQPIDWLKIYANIGKTSRNPNVQEFMYAYNDVNNPYSVNPYLHGEVSINKEVGFNIFKQGFLTDDDTIKMKVNYFDNIVKNYILQTQFYLCQKDKMYMCNYDDYDINPANTDADTVGIFINIPDKTPVKGWEIEGGYDFGRFYTNISWSKTLTGIDNDYLTSLGFAPARTLPSLVWGIDFGTRWLNNKLIIGTRISYTGKDYVPTGDLDTKDRPINEVVAPTPKLIDAYLIYQPKKNVQLFFNVDNLTNKIYNYPLSGGTLGVGNTGDRSDWANKGTGRGRTMYGGISWKF